MAETDNTGTFLDLGASAFAKCSSFLQGAVGLFEKRDDGAKRLNPEAFQCLFLFSPNPFLNGRKPVDVEYSLDCAVRLPQIDVDQLLSEAVRTFTGNPNARVERSVIRDFLFDLYRAAQIDATTEAAQKDRAGFQRDLGAITRLLNALLTGGEGWPRKNENPIDRALIEATVSYAANLSSSLLSFIPKFGAPAAATAKGAIDFLFFVGDYLAEYRAAYTALAYRLSGNERYERIANAYAARYGFKPSTYTIRQWCLAGGEVNPDLAPDGTTTAYVRAATERKALLETLQSAPLVASELFDKPFNVAIEWTGAQTPFLAANLLAIYGPIMQADTDARFYNAMVAALEAKAGAGPALPLINKSTGPVLLTAYSALYAALLGIYSRSEVDDIIKGLEGADADEESLVASQANVLNPNACGLTADGDYPGSLSWKFWDGKDEKAAYREMAENIGVTRHDNGTPGGCPNARLWMPYWEDTAGGNFDREPNALFPNDYRLHLRRIARTIMFAEGFNAITLDTSFWGSCTLLAGGGCTTKFNIGVFAATPARYIGQRLREVEKLWDGYAQKMVPGGGPDVRQAFLTYFFHIARDGRPPLVNDLAQLFAEWAAKNGNESMWRDSARFGPIIAPVAEGGLGALNSMQALFLWILTGTTKLAPVPTKSDPKFKAVIAACPGGTDDLSCLPCDIIKERRPVGLPELTVPMELTWTGVKGVKGSPEYAAWVKLFTDAGYPSYYIDCTFRDVKLTAGAGASEPQPPPSSTVGPNAEGNCPSGYVKRTMGSFVVCDPLRTASLVGGGSILNLTKKPDVQRPVDGACPTGYRPSTFTLGGRSIPICVEGTTPDVKLPRRLSGLTPMSMQGIQRPLMVELAGRKK